MHVVFIHGPAASGKHTVGTHLSATTGLPLFHNHLAVDAAKALFAFGSPPFNALRAAIWRAAFTEATASRRSFIFTFHPEATVDPALIGELTGIVAAGGGQVDFVALTCSRATVLQRLANAGRAQFGKLTDAGLYAAIEAQGGFEFPALPPPLLVIDTDEVGAEEAARQIASAVGAATAAREGSSGASGR